jgi:uncharacterized protein
MPEEFNPFLLQGYAGADTFCDRVDELAFLREAMANQRNVTIISLRRLGKTAFIRHFFASQRKFIPVFVDLYRTTDQAGMVLLIVQEALKQVGKPTSAMLKEVAQVMRSLEFSLNFDPLTGLPELGVSARPGLKEAMALDELFTYLEKQAQARGHRPGRVPADRGIPREQHRGAVARTGAEAAQRAVHLLRQRPADDASHLR